MAEGLQAGRLDVPVVADLSGFAQKLRAEVEAAAEGLAAAVKVKIDEKGLRKRLKKAVEEASKGVTATIRVKIDEDRFRAELDSVRRRLGEADLNLPIRPEGDGGGGRRGDGLLPGLRGLIAGAQGEADRSPVNVPVRMRMPGRGRGGLRMLGIGALVSLLEPAVALLGQYGAGLTALVSSMAPAVGVLGALPGIIVAAGTAAIGTKLAFSGFGDAVSETMKAQQALAADGKISEAQQAKLDESLGKLSKSARKAVTAVVDLSGGWKKLRKGVSERFFSKVADDIKPLAKSVFPLLKTALGDSAAQMGSAAERGAKFMRSGVFRKDFKTITRSNSRVLGNLTKGLGNLGRTTLDFVVASGPFAERVSRGGARLTQYMRASVKAGRETGSLARFLDHAGDKAVQLGRTTSSLIKGLGGVGKAAMDTGDAMFDGFEGTMQRFDRWANSGAGQKAMKKMFSDAAPVFHEVNMLFGDMMRGIGHAMQDGGITDLVRQIRTELGPALGTVFSALGDTIGPAVVSVISNIATAIGHLSAAGSGLGVLLVTFNGLMQIFNTIMTVIPGANTALAVFLGTMLALKVVSGVATMLRGFGTSVTAAGTSVRTLGTTMRGTLGPGVMGPQINTWQRMGLAYTGAAAGAGRLAGSLRGIGAANRVASRAIGGMTSALGGPLGIAIVGVTIGLGLLASRQQAAARATQAHKERVDALGQALAQSGGAIDANVRAQAAQLLQDTELAKGKGKLVDMMQKAGVGIGPLTDAYLGQGKTLAELQKELQLTADAHVEYVTTTAGAAKGWDAEGLAAIRAKDALGEVRGELEESQRKNKQLADAMTGSGAAGTTAYGRLQAAVQTFGDKTKSADERVDALKKALDALNGNTQSFHDAQTQLNSVMLQIDDAMKGNIDRADGWGRALVANDGLVNTTTRNGQNLNSQLTELRDSMLAVATRSQEAAEQGLMPMSEAMDKSQGAMDKARAKAIQLARDMGIPKDQAKALADQMGLVPSTITTLMATAGVPAATAEFLGLRRVLDGIKPGKSIQVTAPTTEARSQLEALGFTVQRIQGSKNVVITAPTGAARVNIDALAKDIANAPDKKNVTVQAIIKQAAGDLKNVQDKVASLPKGASIDVKAPTKTAQAALKDLGYKIKTVDGSNGKTVRITAPNKTALAQVQAIQGKINSLTGKTVHVNIQYHSLNKPSVVATPEADGGIMRYANGGIRKAAGRVKAFANGAEQHIAQIAKAGEMRLWAEPETYPGEAYIPLAPSKRKRSEEILNTVADMFGGTVIYPGRGALRGYADGAVLGHRSSPIRKTTASHASATTGSGALVGGDLNLNIAAVENATGALQEAMFELRRMKLGGA
ncbi:hypothetical protein OG345_41865 (plasmid) [Streptomyces sp. NBC_01220]|uniref:hypothetical protein n=1 Tax=Streptomyces sp. NBC_01220 TaxID=2903781 RepID=UPI00352F1CFC|nr:hypothetical protein OG345_41865 [Streptomyces sp. NBC_01220]